MSTVLPKKYQNLSTGEILEKLGHEEELQSLLKGIGVYRSLFSELQFCDGSRDALLTVIIDLLKENSRLTNELSLSQEEIGVYLSDGFPT